MSRQLDCVGERNLAEIVRALGVGAARGCQIKEAALGKLSASIADWAGTQSRKCIMKVTVRAAERATLLDQAPDGLRYLSLDCFDTLVWRSVQAPRDVFADLPIAGGGVGPRMWAEQRARKSAKFSEIGRASCRERVCQYV